MRSASVLDQRGLPRYVLPEQRFAQACILADTLACMIPALSNTPAASRSLLTPSSLTRRGFLVAGGGTMVVGMAALAGCKQVQPSAGKPSSEPVVLYSSIDTDVLDEMVAECQRATGCKLAVVGDTEATKTAGLVMRVISEQGSPKADIFWSSEAMGCAMLASRGLLRPGLVVAGVSVDSAAKRRPELLGQDGRWVGMALRIRQGVVASDRVAQNELPKCLGHLSLARFSGRIGMARPQFGTTQGHMAFLASAYGPERFEHWLQDLSNNGMRLFDGNGAVVRAVANGQIDLGLTDSDDVLAGQAQGWKLGAVNLSSELSASGFDAAGDAPTGPLLIPASVGVVANRPVRPEVEIVLAWMLSGAAEAALGASAFATIAAADLPNANWHPRLERPDEYVLADWDRVLQAAQVAAELCTRHLNR